jgi:addiction module HigA family antidote
VPAHLWGFNPRPRMEGDITVPAVRISRVCNEKSGISEDTALRLARFFGTSVEFWTGIQAHYDTECTRSMIGRVDRGLPWLQADVCFLRLPPGFPAVPQYLSHTFGCSPAPAQNRTSGFPIHPALRSIFRSLVGHDADSDFYGYKSLATRPI